jgi:hypothetical protein
VLATWDVQVWPEYDQPTVLVIATGSVVTGTTFPQSLSFPLPADASIHAVAYPGEAGNLLTLPWTTEAGPAGQAVVFELNQPHFVVEYYADILSVPPNRSFDLDLGIPYAAQQATVTLRQPARASALQVTPAMAAAGVDELGNPTYALDLGPLAAGQSVPFQVSYTKVDGEPSRPAAGLHSGGCGDARAGRGRAELVAVGAGHRRGGSGRHGDPLCRSKSAQRSRLAPDSAARGPQKRGARGPAARCGQQAGGQCCCKPVLCPVWTTV